MDRIIPGMDGALSKELMKVLKKQKIKFQLSHKVKSVERKGDEVIVKADNKKGEEITFTGDYCLVAVGRHAYTDGLNLEAAGVQLEERGRVAVNEHLQTNVSNIYVVHYIILYGSFVGVGLYYFLNHSLAPTVIIPGAIAFMVTCTFLALQYEKHKIFIKATIANALKQGTVLIEPWATFAFKLTKDLFIKIRNATLKLFRLVKD